MKRLLGAFFVLASLSFLAAATYYRLDSVTTVEKSKKWNPKVVIEGNTYKYEGQFIKIEVEPLLLKDIAAYYEKKGLSNPFDEVPEGYNYVFFRIRLENLSKESNLEFSPSMALMEDCLPKDETSVFQMFYEKQGGEKKLEACGKTIFLKPLNLPPKTWIERLMFFEYDDPMPRKKTSLVLANITVGREIFEEVFPFRMKFIKETR